MPVASLARREVFQLAYLPHVVAAHFNTLSLLDQTGRNASPKLADAITRALSALPKRGPEVVSCVMQVERIMAAHGATLPAPPKLPEECFQWAEKVASFVRESMDPRRWDTAGKDRVDVSAMVADTTNLIIYTLAQRLGDAEHSFRLAGLTARLLGEDANNPLLLGQRQRLVADLVRDRERLEGTLRDQELPGVRLGRLVPLALRKVIDSIVANPQTAQALDVTLAVVTEAAIQVERSVVSRPFSETVAEAKAGKVTPAMLERALLEYPSVRGTVHERTLWLATDGDRPGFEACRFQENEVDWVVVDAATPEASIHFGKAQLPRLRQLAEAIAVEAAATTWSGVRFDALVKYPAYRVLLRGNDLRNLVWSDATGRPFVGVFTTDDALDKFLAEKPELGEVVERRWMPGAALFPVLTKLGLAGFVLNPSGPGASRAFNRGTLGSLGLACTMANVPPQDKPSASVAFRLKRPYDSEDDLVAGDGHGIRKTGMMLFGAASRPIGLIVRFEIALRDGTPVFRGEGKVVAHHPSNDRSSPGALQVRFTRLDPRGKSLVDRVVALAEGRPPPSTRSPLSLPPPAPPPGASAFPGPMSIVPSPPESFSLDEPQIDVTVVEASVSFKLPPPPDFSRPSSPPIDVTVVTDTEVEPVLTPAPTPISTEFLVSPPRPRSAFPPPPLEISVPIVAAAPAPTEAPALVVSDADATRKLDIEAVPVRPRLSLGDLDIPVTLDVDLDEPTIAFNPERLAPRDDAALPHYELESPPDSFSAAPTALPPVASPERLGLQDEEPDSLVDTSPRPPRVAVAIDPMLLDENYDDRTARLDPKPAASTSGAAGASAAPAKATNEDREALLHKLRARSTGTPATKRDDGSLDRLRARSARILPALRGSSPAARPRR